MRTRREVCTFIVAALIATAILSPRPALPAADTTTVVVGGTGTALGVARWLGNAFEMANPGISVKILPSIGSGGAIKALSNSALDVAFVSRSLTAKESELGLVSLDLARTPLIIIVRSDNKASNLTTSELRRILLDQMQTWPDGLLIRPILRAKGDTDSMLIKKLSAEISDAYDSALARPGMLVAMNDQECLRMVTETPGAIGFTTLTQLLVEGGSVKALSFNGRFPTTEGLRDGSYSPEKSISLVTRPKPSAATRRFVDFLRSPDARKILESAGTLPIEPAVGR
jgi:phosphate transport system substrate-binding protein